MVKKPEFGAEQRTSMAERIEKSARLLRAMVRAECDKEAEILINRILDELAILDTKRSNAEDRKKRSPHMQAVLAGTIKAR